MEKKRVGIIGGGIVGTALGYNLSLHPNIEVCLFEKELDRLWTTAKSAGTVCLFDDSISHEYLGHAAVRLPDLRADGSRKKKDQPDLTKPERWWWLPTRKLKLTSRLVLR